jgi:hypothetical protein
MERLYRLETARDAGSGGVERKFSSSKPTSKSQTITGTKEHEDNLEFQFLVVFPS